MSIDQPLNPSLYDALRTQFGGVKVARRGRETDLIEEKVNGESRIGLLSWGECYRINCPFCSDRRQRLYVNYKFGQRFNGRSCLILAHCYNETACLSGRYDRRKLFVEMIDLSESELARVSVRAGREDASFDDEPAIMPGPCTPIDEAPVWNKARRYLEETRGFDAGRLGRSYDVSVCRDSFFFQMPGRIVIPIFKGGELAGWQGRYPEDLPWHDRDRRRSLPVKYYNMPGAQFERLLYNIDVAKNYETGVVVEGPSDVWAGGAPFVGIFKSDVSDYQRRDLFAVFRERSLVFCLDPEPDVMKKTAKFLEEHGRDYTGEICAVWLPKGRDPGSLDRDFLRGYITEEAKKQGVTVSWRKV
jgi:hypothetical protein